MTITKHGDPLAETFRGTCTRCGCCVECDRHEAVWLDTLCKTNRRYAILCPCCAGWQSWPPYILLMPKV